MEDDLMADDDFKKFDRPKAIHCSIPACNLKTLPPQNGPNFGWHRKRCCIPECKTRAHVCLKGRLCTYRVPHSIEKLKFKFPQHKEADLQKWMDDLRRKLMNIPELKNQETADKWLDGKLYICRRHFEEKDVKKCRAKTVLHFGAMPTRNMPKMPMCCSVLPPPIDRNAPKPHALKECCYRKGLHKLPKNGMFPE